MTYSTPGAEALQPCKKTSVFIRAFDHISSISPDILTPLEAALAQREDLKPDPGPAGRPRCPSRSLLRAYLMLQYTGLITGYKMVVLERNLSKESGRIYDALQLCGFTKLPSHSTFRRAFGVLDSKPELVDSALSALSEALKALPWVVPVEKAEKEEDAPAKSYDYPKRRRQASLSDDELEARIWKTTPDEFARREVETRAWFLEQWWPNGCPRCPHYPSEDIWTIESKKPAPYRCKRCHAYFSERTGTIMQDSKLDYVDWLEVMRAVLKVKGTSALVISLDRGISRNTALSVSHKVRYCMKEDSGVAEGWLQIDGTALGGLEKNKHWDKRLHNGGGIAGKTPLIGVLDHAGGEIFFILSDEVNSPELRALVRAKLPNGGVLVSDSKNTYKSLVEQLRKEGLDIVHLTVNHSSRTGGRYRTKDKYEDEHASTNGIESVFNMVKGALGTYQHVTAEYLPLYLAEVMWRYNHRDENQEDQLKAIARNMYGRRITVEEMRRDAKETMLGKDQPHQPEFMEVPAETRKKAKAQTRQHEPLKVAAGTGKKARAEPRQHEPLKVAAGTGKKARAEPRQPALM